MTFERPEPEDYPFGVRIEAVDPDGNRISLRHQRRKDRAPGAPTPRTWVQEARMRARMGVQALRPAGRGVTPFQQIAVPAQDGIRPDEEP